MIPDSSRGYGVFCIGICFQAGYKIKYYFDMINDTIIESDPRSGDVIYTREDAPYDIICMCCYPSFNLWFDPDKFNWKYSEYLIAYCDKHKYVWWEDYLIRKIL